MGNKNAKNIVLPHSQAKLDLYKSYLEKYLPILTLAKGITKLNFYDIFCGIGLYKDGNIGSPLIAVNAINKTNELIDSKGWKRKPITLNINDGNEDKVKNVKNLLKGVKISNCVINYNSLDANKMLEKVIVEINGFPGSERNLVFIDPYGYSEIDKQKLISLLSKGYTEVVLFLPVMQMYRFSEIALNDFERKCYEDLRKFITDFLPYSQEFQSVFDFINEVTKAFTFGRKYFSCSHYIERDKGNYYAIFFITSHIYGLERMLEVKWKADPSKGKGFKQENWGLFEDIRVDYNKNIQLDYLRGILIENLKQTNDGLSNIELYHLALSNEFLPSHMNRIIKDLKKQKKIISHDSKHNEHDFKNATYIDYDHYKTKNHVIYFKLK